MQVSQQGRALLSALFDHVEPGRAYSLLDFPNHSNVGDSAIWLGETELLRSITGSEPAYVSTCGSDYDAAALRRALPEGPIFLHGGGNFGDVWPEHQAFRLQILREFPDRAVIQLSQTIRFGRPEGIQETADAIATHGDFHLMVRDRPSLAFAEAHFACKTTLVPDFAFGLGMLPRKSRRKYRTLALMRSDHEAGSLDRDRIKRLPDTLYCDWLGDPRSSLRRARWTARLSSLLERHDPNAARAELFHEQATARLRRGLALIDSAEKVVTDRLHVHILSTLLGVPHVALDNNYGKIHGYIDQWSAESLSATKASTVEEAIGILEAA